MALRDEAVYLVRPGTRPLLQDEVESVHRRLVPGDAGQVVLDHGDSREIAAAHAGGYLAGGTGGRAGTGPTPDRCSPDRGSWRFPQDPRDPEAVRLHLRGLGQDLLPVQARTPDVFTKDVGQREGVGGGGHTLDVERLDVGRVLEHSGQLGGVPFELVVGKLEARQAGDVRDVLLGNGRGQGAIVTTPESAATIGRRRRRYLRGQPGKQSGPRPGQVSEHR